MHIKKAIRAARVEAKKARVIIAIVKSPIDNAEDEDGDIGYCPLAAIPYLFRWGTLIARIHPDGWLERATPKLQKV